MVNLISNWNSFNSKSKSINFQVSNILLCINDFPYISYSYSPCSQLLKRFNCSISDYQYPVINYANFFLYNSHFLDKSFGRKASLHTLAFSLQDSRNFFNSQIKNHVLTKFEKSRLSALHTLISIAMIACSLFFNF